MSSWSSGRAWLLLLCVAREDEERAGVREEEMEEENGAASRERRRGRAGLPPRGEALDESGPSVVLDDGATRVITGRRAGDMGSVPLAIALFSGPGVR